jgi:excisionase family DNA binding protein
MKGKLTVQEAASRLDLDPSRLRFLASSGQIRAEKVGRQWLLDERAVERRSRVSRRAGRPFEAANAWALLLLASGKRPKGVDPSALSRLRRLLRSEDFEALAPRLGKRGETNEFRAHPGEMKYVIGDKDFLATGISAAGALGLDLVSGSEADGYIAASKFGPFVKRHALARDEDTNVTLRIVPDRAWDLLRPEGVAPRAAVALDLMDEADPRSVNAGREAIESVLESMRV